MPQTTLTRGALVGWDLPCISRHLGGACNKTRRSQTATLFCGSLGNQDIEEGEEKQSMCTNGGFLSTVFAMDFPCAWHHRRPSRGAEISN